MTDTTVIMGSGDTDVKDTCPVCGGKVGGQPCPVILLSSLFTSNPGVRGGEDDREVWDLSPGRLRESRKY